MATTARDGAVPDANDITQAQPAIGAHGDPDPERQLDSDSDSSSDEEDSHERERRRRREREETKHHKVHGGHLPLSWRHLFRLPVVRQWIGAAKDGSTPILYKPPEERVVDKTDLLFDLIFVGLIHVIAESAITPISPLTAGIFILVFYPAFNLWREVRDYGNQSGVDDIPQRLFVLVMMILLIGYGSNAAAIEVELNEPEAEEGAGGEQGVDQSAGEGGGEGIEPGTSISSGLHLPPSSYKAIHAAAGFFLVAKLIRLFVYLTYAVYLKKFRGSFIANAASAAFMAFFYLPLLFITNNTAIIVLAGLGQFFGTWLRGIFGVIADIDKYQRNIGLGRHGFIVAKSLEHIIERNTQFTMIVLGEMIINSFYIPRDGQIGLHTEYGRSIMGIILAFCLAMLYFDADSCRTFRHALRAGWERSLHWDALHHPMTASILLASAAMTTMIAESEVNQGAQWYFGGGLAIAVLSITLMGVLHRPHDKPGSAWVPRPIRMGLRFCVVAIFAAVPASSLHSSFAFLALYAGVLAFLVIFETIGKLGTEPMDELAAESKLTAKEASDPEKAGETPHAQNGTSTAVNGRTAESRLGAKVHKERRAHTMTGEDALDEKNAGKIHIHHEEKLTGHERGEDDTGLDASLGEVIAVRIGMKQVLAYAA